MSASLAVFELLAVGIMALGAIGTALFLGAWWTRDEEPPPLLAGHTARNASEVFATLALSTAIGAMVFVLVPILILMGPFLLLAAWTLLEPPPQARIA